MGPEIFIQFCPQCFELSAIQTQAHQADCVIPGSGQTTTRPLEQWSTRGECKPTLSSQICLWRHLPISSEAQVRNLLLPLQDVGDFQQLITSASKNQPPMA